MRLLLATILFGCILVAFSANTGKFQARWKNFKARNGKIYSNAEEENRRLRICEDKLKLIDEINDGYERGEVNYYTSENSDCDKTSEEFIKGRTGWKPPASRSKRALSSTIYRFGSGRPTFRIYSADGTVTIPTSLDWITKANWTEPVQNQKECGSCWAFSTASVLSAHIAIKKKINVVLSQQQFIDCSKIYETNGCNGGSQANALEYNIVKGNIPQSAYPYLNKEATCNTTVISKSTFHNVTTFYQINPDYDSLIEALTKFGPVTVSVDVEAGFQNYIGGVYDGKLANGTIECDPSRINHAVTLVGFGTDSKTNLNFWKIKNTWGTGWGEGGYIRMLRSKTNNICGIFDYAYVPIS